MHRVFIPTKDIDARQAVITDASTLHHLKAVLRVKPGEGISFADDQGAEYLGIIDKIESRRIVCTLQSRTSSAVNECSLTVACALVKGSGFEEIVEQLSQAGARRIIPLLTERVISRWPKHKVEERVARLRRIALSAATQSKRRDVLSVEMPCSFKDALALAASCDLKLIPCLERERVPLQEALRGASFKAPFILIGPEGDFSETEVAAARAAGFVPVSLGPRVLRVATAAVCAAFFITHHAHR